MAITLRKSKLQRTLLAALLAVFVISSSIFAQKEGASAWYSVASIQRVNKANRQHAKPLPRKQTASLLTFQWHLLKKNDDDSAAEADPTTTFQTGDKLKVAITANQNGYLYIVNQPEGKDGVVLFPDPRINRGQNYIVKDREYTIPGFCQDEEDPKDCWFKMAPPAGRETILVILSRDKITTLPNRADKAFAAVKRSVVEDLIRTSDQKVQQLSGELTIPGKKTVRYATRVQNTNPKDNEELIAKIELTHGD